MGLNNTLMGRMLIGPVVSQSMFVRSDWRDMCNSKRGGTVAWAVHLVSRVIVLAIVIASELRVWVYLISCYFAISILKIRTFLEHRAHGDAIARTVIIDDKGPLAFLFLNNNRHAVHAYASADRVVQYAPTLPAKLVKL